MWTAGKWYHFFISHRLLIINSYWNRNAISLQTFLLLLLLNSKWYSKENGTLTVAFLYFFHAFGIHQSGCVILCIPFYPTGPIFLRIAIILEELSTAQTYFIFSLWHCDQNFSDKKSFTVMQGRHTGPCNQKPLITSQKLEVYSKAFTYMVQTAFMLKC